jgi:hypothetical protein
MGKGIAIQLNGSDDSGEFFDLKPNVIRDASNKIVSGISIGDVVQQNTALILIAVPGELKHAPTLGVGLHNSLLDDEFLGIRHLCRRNFALDGMKIERLELYNKNNIDIKTTY